jgi:uncharacterized protein
MKNPHMQNNLESSPSPYLQQHANNPVHWQQWNDQTLDLAIAQDKPLLISIGYAACHWCHIMAHETFEDETSAHIMNENFICIKIDREERPDIDAIYMQAVQMMTGSGGWPLHVFALPDGRPFFGGTYFPTDQWQQLCRSAAHEFHNNRDRLITYAHDLEKGMRVRVPVISSQVKTQFDLNTVKEAALNLQDRFDSENGGFLGAPKFPMPSLLNFLYDYSLLAGDETINQHVKYSVKKMALGGIYDHIGGGFARYSVDSRWKVPHFEKMLYDNAQLLSLLSNIQRGDPSPLFSERIRETADFLLRDLRTDQGLFASSLDADSEGIEGKFYTWEKDELRQILGDRYPLAEKVFSVDAYGYWENGQHILQMKNDYENLARTMQIPSQAFHHSVAQIKRDLFQHRQKRISPALDGKAIVSWNGLAIQGLVGAAIAINEPTYLSYAQKSADYILENVRMGDGGLFHLLSQGQAYTPGFLEDYSHMITALISLYQADLDQNWIQQAKSLMEYVFSHFADKETGFFYFTTVNQSQLIRRDIDLTDGVIPSANSVIAHALYNLSTYFEIPSWETGAQKMAANMADELERYPGSYSHWASLLLKLAYPTVDIAITGNNAREYLQQINTDYLPNTLIAGSVDPSSLPVLTDRYNPDQTRVYICHDKVCGEPLDTIEDARREIHNIFQEIPVTR